ncbi:hypothetical protein DRO21_05655 [archaeon]|nr:MAG: hypothetical protein DRO21_05655 [archaeon]
MEDTFEKLYSIWNAIENMKRHFRKGNSLIIRYVFKKIRREGHKCTIIEEYTIKCGEESFPYSFKRTVEGCEWSIIPGDTFLFQVIFDELLPWALENQLPSNEEPKEKPDCETPLTIIWNLDKWQLQIEKIKVIRYKVTPSTADVMLEIPATRRLLRRRRRTSKTIQDISPLQWFRKPETSHRKQYQRRFPQHRRPLDEFEAYLF